MKILAFTDPHANLKVYEKIEARVKKERPDIILCGGDLASFGTGLKSFLKKLNSLETPILIIPGNGPHESEEEIEVYSRALKFVKNIHLKVVHFKSVIFVGIGGEGFSKKHLALEQAQKRIEEEIKKLKEEHNTGKLIVIAHQPPFKTKLDYLPWANHVGSVSIRKFIDKHKPDVCITGHLHENFGKKDKIGNILIINPGPFGKIIEV